MMAVKLRSLKKERTTRIRHPIHEPDPHPSPSSRRSLRPPIRRPRRPLAGDYFDDDYDAVDGDGEEHEGRRKLKLVLKLPLASSRHSSDSEEEEMVKPPKKRRIEDSGDESGGSRHRAQQQQQRRTVRPASAIPKTRLPEREALVDVLDKLQKEDTYSAFARPVDPDELPGYHDVIEHPMDFGTVRRKLAGSVYRSFEQFEDDVSLICSNAMQYNAPDTIYFRQASSIRDMARKRFQELRADANSSGAVGNTKEKASFYTMEKKTLKKPQCRNASEPFHCDISSMKKIIKKHHCRTAPDHFGSDFSCVEKKMVEERQYRAPPRLSGSDISSLDKNRPKDVNGRSAPKPPSSDISSLDKKTLKDVPSMEKKMLKEHQYGTPPKPIGPVISSLDKERLKNVKERNERKPLVSDISSLDEKTVKVSPMEKKMLKERQYRAPPKPIGPVFSSLDKESLKNVKGRSAPKPVGSDISSLDEKTLKDVNGRTAPKPLGSEIAPLDRKTLKDVNGRSEPKPLDSDISSMETNTLRQPYRKTAHEPPVANIASLGKKTLKKPKSRIAPQPLESDISSENKTSKKAHCRTVAEPLESDISSGKKASKSTPCRTASGPLGSDVSSGATVASAADTCTDLGTLEAQGLASCTALGTPQGNVFPSSREATELSSVQLDAVERSGTINGSVDESSSLGESKSEKEDEAPEKSLPSMLVQKTFIVDVNRRETYNTSDEQVVEPDSLFDVFEGEPRQLVSVEPQSEYSYARSLARFAASLGPIAWETVSKRIKQALPPGIKFGPGWVGEYEPLPTPILHVGNGTQQQQQKKLLQPQQQQQQQQQKQLPQPQQQQQQKQLMQPQQQQQQLLQPQTVLRKDRGNKTKSETAQNGKHKNMPFCLQSPATNVMALNRTSTAVEGTNNGRTRDQKQGLFGIDLAHHHATSSSVSQHQKKQETGGFLNTCTNEITAHGPQSSEAEKFKFPSIIPRGRNQVQAELQQLQVVIPQRRNDAVVMNVAGLSNWRSSDSSCPTSSFGIISNEQAGLQYWFGQDSEEQGTIDPLRWMNFSGRNSNQSNNVEVCNNSLEKPMPSIIHAPRLENPSAGAAQAWMSIGAPAEWKSVDGVRNKQVGSISFNSSWKTPTPVSRVHEDSRLKPESVQGVNEASQVQNKGLVIFPQLMTTDLSRLQSPWQGLVQHNKQKDQLPPDLNISFQPPESPLRPSPRMHIDSQHPDLALQL
ncbi:uncharacterized protein M6B38_165060 [Iris pallida]|uniref:Bromo domain-containing protein n=1 Tax=Iris pallida TaxID=29817 RepID=A0AAX6EWV8_IRIPA|nr:uncharacterized protein M6B38_165060 [Iris pallida]